MIKIFASATVALFVLVGLSGRVEAARNCSVPNFRTLDNQTVNSTMTVKTGTRCSIILRSSPGPIDSISIVAQPSHGALRTSGYTVVYTPRKGYVGNDGFTYARSGMDTRNNRVKRTINIAVEVTP